MKVKLVEVLWLDADHEHGWHEYKPKEYQKREYIKSYGLLVDKGTNFVVLSTCKSGSDGDWLGLHRIPTGMVKKITTIMVVEV